MPDDNRFARLGEAVEEEPGDDQGAGADEPDEPLPPAEAGPAFEFEDTTAKSIYVREPTLAVLEDTEFEVESALRREHGLRDMTGREFHDAAVRVLAEHVDDIADAVLEARDERE